VILCQLLNELVLPALLQELVGAIVRRSQGLLRILETELGGGIRQCAHGLLLLGAGDSLRNSLCG